MPEETGKSVKAKLVVVLKANDVVVAEAEDPALWQRVLAAINAGHRAVASLGSLDESLSDPPPNDGSDNSLVIKLAGQLGLTVEPVVAALDPKTASPYLTLSEHCWEAMKKKVPATGPTAMSPIVVAATLLACWFRVAGLGNPTQAQAQQVLGTINLGDGNPSRGIKRASWLQRRGGGQVALNPAEISRAMKVTAFFCSKQWEAERP
jgi:hypothetical protein